MQNKCVDNGNGNGVMQTSVMHHVEKMLYNRNVDIANRYISVRRNIFNVFLKKNNTLVFLITVIIIRNIFNEYYDGRHVIYFNLR